MSAIREIRRRTVRDIRNAKGKVPVVCLTAHSAPMAKLLDPHVDLLLVGDSLGMVVYGFSSTLPVTLDMMIAHGAAVVRGSSRAVVVIDLPFATYQESPEQAYRSAARTMIETGAQAVKIEGGVEMAPTIRFLTQRGIPVMAHIGLTPQSVNTLGGFRTQGRDEAGAAALIADAKAVEEAGAFSVVIEGTVATVATAISEAISIPTIGIGASAACDGQVLVIDDLLGLFTDFTPKFVKKYADLATIVSGAASAYADEVKARVFPGPEHVV
ncbi:3-methyl-2-oxobutanoate hydroxymethyltransferase [Pinisolibacter aquiterrae]|uniref:3-methyl-2-oxobutanoate hydroxymethyltransferase n=1 Tax=Pinisolibacter aquiterrae TaxID=2815579 RepID=UPI001C3D3B45|nr:3-methyl-2-oxobutanoate hydroxymethyltransferase [Pinisolibacter aquiterrae]MBV5263513.1 3-methyl-2-oxobutanoate hydroxymethyltransferase [Pinisolibacter aquiterrae]MCC8237433.1 3-methyl-2-oxobutanoate hydroxymethyltransferase [Pinisolibacter aquiterrae]